MSSASREDHRLDVAQRQECLATDNLTVQLQSLGAEKALLVQKGEDLLPEEHLCRLLVDVGHGVPCPFAIPSAA